MRVIQLIDTDGIPKCCRFDSRQQTRLSSIFLKLQASNFLSMRNICFCINMNTRCLLINSINYYFCASCIFELLILIAQWLEKKIIRYVHTVQKSTVLDTRRQCQEIIKQNDLPQCDRGTPLTFSLPCPLNIKPATAL